MNGKVAGSGSDANEPYAIALFIPSSPSISFTAATSATSSHPHSA